MGRFRPSVVVRQPLLLCAGIVVVAVALLGLHQLSLNHTAAGPSARSAAAAAQLGHHDAGGEVGDHAHLVAPAEEHPWSAVDGCPGCAGHQVMALTCLAVLMVVAIGWALAGPVEWPGLRLRPRLMRLLPRPPCRRSPRVNLVELSISRT